MSNYPTDGGNSCAYDCVAWVDEKDRDPKIIKAGSEEGIFIATFDMDLIRDFRQKEAWRLEHRRNFYKD